MSMNIRKGKAFATAEERQAPTKVMGKSMVANKTKEARLANAEKLNEFGGKRFLGLTPKGKEVYVYYIIDRKTMSITMSFSYRPGILLEDGAKFANNRYSTAKHMRLTNSNGEMTRKLTKKQSNEVTEKTLHHLMRLKHLNDMKFHKGYKNGKVTRLMARYVTDVIYTGNYESASKLPTTDDILEVWNFSREGEYFVPEQQWQYPDDLNDI